MSARLGELDVSSVMGARLGRGPGVPAGYLPEILRAVLLVFLWAPGRELPLAELAGKSSCSPSAVRMVCRDLAAAGLLAVRSEPMSRTGAAVRNLYRLKPAAVRLFRPLLEVGS